MLVIDLVLLYLGLGVIFIIGNWQLIAAVILAILTLLAFITLVRQAAALIFGIDFDYASDIESGQSRSRGAIIKCFVGWGASYLTLALISGYLFYGGRGVILAFYFAVLVFGVTAFIIKMAEFISRAEGQTVRP